MAIIKIKNPAIDLDAAEIPNLPASKITSGTFSDARIADLSATKLTGSISDARLPANALNSNVDLTNLSASNLTSGTIPTARITALPAGVGGKVLQIVQTVKVDAFSVSPSANTVYDVTGLSVSITPTSSSNKVFVMLQMNNVSSSSTGGPGVYTKILRDSTVLTSNTSGGQADSFDSFCGGVGGGMANNERARDKHHINFLDSPSTTSAITYKAQLVTGGSGYTVTVNRWGLNTDVGSVSTITAMEISA